MSFTYIFEDDYFDNETSIDYNPNANTNACNFKPLEPTAAYTLSLILNINCLLAIPGNVLVGLVIRTSRQVLTSSDIYLFHLTVADGLMALTLPFFSVELVQGWLLGDFMCKFHSLIFEANFYTSITFLACISVDRYLVIVHANEAHGNQQRKCSRLLCAAVWALGWAFALPALFNEITIIKSKYDDSERYHCMFGSSSVWRLATRGFRHIFGFLVPLMVMIVFYSITIARLMNTRGFQKHRAMKVIVVVVIVFLLCWMPYHITLLVDTLMRANLIPFECSKRMSLTLALDVTGTLALLHSCINPILYAFVGEKFRKKMKLLLQRKVRQERTSGLKFSRSTSQTSERAGTVL